MTKPPAAVIIGATGTVGRGIARTLIAAGWTVIAAGRDGGKLAALKSELGAIVTVVGSVEDDAAAARLAAAIRATGALPDAVITSINVPAAPRRLLDMSDEAFLELFRGNVSTHFCAAKALLPLLSENGRYIGLGGGMADFTLSGMGGVSICQAAQRNLFRFLAQEYDGHGVSVVELMLYSHIVGPEAADSEEPRNIRADEVGQHVLAMLERPGDFPGPIAALKSRKQVGSPERVS